MATIKTVERNIGNLEGFDVIIKHPDGRDVRSDKENLPAYPFQKGAKGAMTAAQWFRKRFKQAYPGFSCDVLYATGEKASGNTKLSNVRDSYLGD
jgi:hypothetical protein